MNEILQGDVIDKLKEIADSTVQCVVTSPPYWGLRDYGTATWEGGDEDCDHRTFDNDIENAGEKQKTNIGSHRTFKDICKRCGAKRIDNQLGLEKTPELYVEKMVEVFREVKRVLKDDGTVWLNLGDSYNGSGKAGNKNNEYFNKHTEFGKPAKNKDKIGVPTNIKNLKPKNLVGIPWRVAFALQADGWYLRQDIIWHKPNPMPESVQDRCTKSHEYIFLLTKSAQYFYDNDAIREDQQSSSLDRLKRGWNGDGDRGYPNGPQNHLKNYFNKTNDEINNLQGRNKRSVWTINTQPYKDAHFAVFPPKIPELCIKAGSKEGDTVLDPFFGSGTTGWVAQRLGRQWIGIELNEEYIKIANKRFAQRELFIAK
ncbi:DNA modification methylase [uncultured Mediterranean phage uvDeep-CGR2-KM18-C269]|nr:DNA modification methylase [uncultured Mediterranean phage uvDeep-CGR2-KM18-C269]